MLASFAVVVLQADSEPNANKYFSLHNRGDAVSIDWHEWASSTFIAPIALLLIVLIYF